MPSKNSQHKATRGRGTKAERKTARRTAAEAGQGPLYPHRTDRASAGEGKRKLGPRRVR